MAGQLADWIVQVGPADASSQAEIAPSVQGLPPLQAALRSSACKFTPVAGSVPAWSLASRMITRSKADGAAFACAAT